LDIVALDLFNGIPPDPQVSQLLGWFVLLLHLLLHRY